MMTRSPKKKLDGVSSYLFDTWPHLDWTGIPLPPPMPGNCRKRSEATSERTLILILIPKRATRAPDPITKQGIDWRVSFGAKDLLPGYGRAAAWSSLWVVHSDAVKALDSRFRL